MMTTNKEVKKQTEKDHKITESLKLNLAKINKFDS